MTSKTIKKTWRAEVAPDVKVIINSEMFGVNIDRGEDNAVELNAEFIISGMSEDTELEIPIETEWDEEANEVRIDISPDWEMDDCMSGVSVEAHIELRVPEKLTLEVDSENGGLSVSNLTGHLRLNNENGGLNITACDATMELENENGRMTVSDCAGTAKITCENGGVNVSKAHFSQADVKNENGRIVFEFTDQTDGRFTFLSENGKVTLVVPEAIEFDLAAETENGSLHMGIEGDYDTNRSHHRRHVKMVRGSGKVKIEVKTENGPIILTDTPVEKNGRHSYRFGWSHHSPRHASHKRIRKHLHKVMDKEKMHEYRHKMMKMGKKMKNLAKDKEANKDEMKALGREMGHLGAAFGEQFSGVGKAIAESLSTGFKESGMENFFEGMFDHSHRPPRPERPARHARPADPVESEHTAQSKLQVLQLLRDGQINVEEAERLLKAID
ncbi:MAG: DUF4097 domain-containing protein [Candidatus Cloacimonetes bacterium]|nr:DUF4097 domain-containing protein [Candidatus Cloacimonadota bacterium]